MKLLVVGSSGFIGRHLMEQGRAMGHEMVGCDFDNGADLPMPSRQLVAGHLKGVGRVIHSAGVLGTYETLEDPARAVTANVIQMLHVLEICREAKVPFTYLTLGNNWLNPYSITKNCAAEFVRMFNVVHGLPTQVAVCYNVFGPYQKWRPVRKIVPEFMTRLLDGRPLELFANGTQETDMVYAPDVARAILRSTQNGTEHYGSGIPRTVLSVAIDCCDALGVNPNSARVEKNPFNRPGETGHAAIAPYVLPDQTDYAEAMKITAEWYRANYQP